MGSLRKIHTRVVPSSQGWRCIQATGIPGPSVRDHHAHPLKAPCPFPALPAMKVTHVRVPSDTAYVLRWRKARPRVPSTDPDLAPASTEAASATTLKTGVLTMLGLSRSPWKGKENGVCVLDQAAATFMCKRHP